MRKLGPRRLNNLREVTQRVCCRHGLVSHPGVPDSSGHALSKQLLFDLSMGFGVGSASVMEVGQPKALPVSAGQAGLRSEGAQGQGWGAGDCVGGSLPRALLPLQAAALPSQNTLLIITKQ